MKASAEDGGEKVAVRRNLGTNYPSATFSNPAPDSFLVSKIVCAKLSFRVAFLSVHYSSVHHG